MRFYPLLPLYILKNVNLSVILTKICDSCGILIEFNLQKETILFKQLWFGLISRQFH